MYKKAWCTCKVVLLIRPIGFLSFSLPSPSSLFKPPMILRASSRFLSSRLLLRVKKKTESTKRSKGRQRPTLDDRSSVPSYRGVSWERVDCIAFLTLSLLSSSSLLKLPNILSLEDEHLAKRKIIVGPCLSLLPSFEWLSIRRTSL